MGVEPTTSAMRMLRSSQLSYIPKCDNLLKKAVFIGWLERANFFDIAVNCANRATASDHEIDITIA